MYLKHTSSKNHNLKLIMKNIIFLIFDESNYFRIKIYIRISLVRIHTFAAAANLPSKSPEQS